MNLNEEQLKELEVMGGLFFDVEDIMINIGLPLYEKEEFESILKHEKDNPIFLAYHKGRLKLEVELRTATKQAALNGSNPAQTAMWNLRAQL